jgi:hypothetical protein
VAIFSCIEVPEDGRFLKGLGITDADLVKYVVERANGSLQGDAFNSLVENRVLGQANLERVRRIVKQFPIPG